MSRNITNNQRPTLNVIDSITSVPFAVGGNSSDKSINVNITSGGSGGTQYTDGQAAPAHPVGNALEFNNSGTWSAVSVANPLPITGSISVGGTTDESAFTAGASTFTSSGGVYNDAVANLTAGQQGAQRLTIARAIHINLRNATGTEIGTSATPVQVSLANTAANATAVKVDGSAVTQPVSLTSTTITGTVSATQSGTWNIGTVTAVTAITNALPAGANVIGHVITDTGSTTAVTGTVTVSGTVTTSPPANASTNIAQINGVTPLMGNGVTGTGSQRVTIASDNTAFSVNATLSAETTKVIGVTRTADGSGNLLTSTSNALDINIKSGSIANTSFAATQATASSLNATVVQGTAAAVTAGWPVINGELADTTGTFTNGTQTNSVTTGTIDGYNTALISINGTYGTATAVFEGSDDGGTTWYAIQGARVADSTIESGYTSLTNITRAWVVTVPGFDQVRVRSTAVASGTVTVRISVTAAPSDSAVSISIGQALPAGTSAIGSVNLSPTASGGWSGYALGGSNAALTTTQTVSAAAGKFGGYMTIINLNSTPAYIQVFDTTGAVTLGSTAPTYIITIPANATATNGLAANMELSNGLVIANGIKIAATTTSNGASTVATGVTGTILYK